MVNFPIHQDSSDHPAGTSHSGTAFFVSTLLHVAVLLLLAATYFTLERDPPEVGINAVMSDGESEQDHDSPNLDFEAIQQEKLFAEVPVTQPSSEIISRDQPVIDGLFGSPDTGGIGRGVGGAEGGVGFFGMEAVGKSFTFVVDCSGSMQGPRFERAMTELTTSLSDLSVTQKFNVIFYHQNPIPMVFQGKRAGLVTANRLNLQRARAWIRKRKAKGGTVPQPALEMALEDKPDVMFFLTDAQEIPRVVRTLVRRWNKHGTTVHTICFGHRGGEALMQGIAEDNKGRYRFVD